MKSTNYFSMFILLLVLVSCSEPTKKSDLNSSENKSKDSCCSKDSVCKEDKTVMQSVITCPKCGYKKMETLPIDVCVIRYDCKKCGEEMFPKKGDCCVYCTYGTHKCPSKQ